MKLKLMLGLLASAMIITQCDQANQEDSVAGTEESSVTSTVLSSGSSTQDSEYVNVKASVDEESLNLSSNLEDWLITAHCGDDGHHYLDKNNSVAKIRVGSNCSQSLDLLVIAGEHIEDPDGKDNIKVDETSSGLGSITADSKFGFKFSQTGSGSASASAKEARYTNLERDITLSENIGESAYRLDLVDKSFSDVVMSTNDSNGILKSFKVAARGEDGIGDGEVSSDGDLTGSGDAKDGLSVTSKVGSVGVSPHPDPSVCGELSKGDQCYELNVSASGAALLSSKCVKGTAQEIYLVFIRDDDANSDIQSATKLKVDVCK
jgi:hypothetical protein